MRKGVIMHDLNTLRRLNREAENIPFLSHPRIIRLRQEVDGIGVPASYRIRLLRTIDRYAKRFVEQPEYSPEDDWSDLESLQQITLEDGMAEAFREQYSRYHSYS